MGYDTGAPWVIVSGLHSGPNPSSGVGVARSLREAYADRVRILGLDYSDDSSGLYSGLFDEVVVLPAWEKTSLRSFSSAARRLLDRTQGLWLSCLDLEARVLRGVMRDHGGALLVPPAAALAGSTKPSFSALSKDGLIGIPAYLPAGDLESSESFDWARRHGWDIWIKGRFYEAARAHSWYAMRQTVRVMEKTWGAGSAFIQENVQGSECNLAFAAIEGVLLESCWMDKVQVTPEGKVWTGVCTPTPPEMATVLQEALARVDWTGGGELEFVRDVESGLPMLIDWNPRFPAWVHGATLTGFNLPASLLDAAWARRGVRVPREPAPAASSEWFTRVVWDVARPAGPRPPTDTALEPRRSAKTLKHPSGMSALANRLADEWKQQVAVEVPPLVGKENGASSAGPGRSLVERVNRLALNRLSQMSPESVPKERCEWVYVSDATELLVECIAERLYQPPTNPPAEVAFSVKTNSHPSLLKDLAGAGLRAEVIGYAERASALAAGFAADRLIINGPGKPAELLDAHASEGGLLIFDSIEEMARAPRTTDSRAEYGVRIRLGGRASRFGIDLTDFAEVSRLVDAIQPETFKNGMTLHTHLPTQATGLKEWSEGVEALVTWGKLLERQADVRITRLDIGGGWDTADFVDKVLPRVKPLWRMAVAQLPALEGLFLEPGRGIAQGTMMAVCRVLEVRRHEVVVGAGITELPSLFEYPHPIACWSPSHGLAIPEPGERRIVGRLCMESDVMAEDIELPSWLSEGDLVAFLQAGSYDYSMGRTFGVGLP